MTIKPEQVEAYVKVAELLVDVGLDAARGIAALVREFHPPAMTEAELDAICVAVVADATARKARRDAEASR
jgi:hypothetical protein